MTSTPSVPIDNETKPQRADAAAKSVSEADSSNTSTSKQVLNSNHPVLTDSTVTTTFPLSTEQLNSENAAETDIETTGSQSGTDKVEEKGSQGVTTHTNEVDRRDEEDNEDEELTMNDIRAAVDEIDENIDEAFENAAQSFWRLANTVTGSVSSAVGDAPSLEKLRSNMSSHLQPFDALSQNISSRLESFPNELPDRVATLAGSVKSVAESVQRNAQQMEIAILSTANSTADNEQQSTTTSSENNTASAEAPVYQPGSTTVAGNRDLANMNDSIRNRFDRSASGFKNVEEEIAKVGATLGKTVGGLWSGLWGSDSKPSGWQRTDGTHSRDVWSGSKKEPRTRFERKIFQLQSDPNTYCEPAKDLDCFEKWGKDFNLDQETEECLEILSTHDAIAELYERVVPNIVEEDTFWMRYYFAKHILMMEEERRKQLLERAESGVQGEEDDGWGDDDWDDDTKEEKSGDRSGDSQAEEVNEDNLLAGGNPNDVEGAVVDQKENVLAVQDESIVAMGSNEKAKVIDKSSASVTASGEDDWGDDWE